MRQRSCCSSIWPPPFFLQVRPGPGAPPGSGPDQSASNDTQPPHPRRLSFNDDISSSSELPQSCRLSCFSFRPSPSLIRAATLYEKARTNGSSSNPSIIVLRGGGLHIWWGAGRRQQCADVAYFSFKFCCFSKHKPTDPTLKGASNIRIVPGIRSYFYSDVKVWSNTYIIFMCYF